MKLSTANALLRLEELHQQRHDDSAYLIVYECAGRYSDGRQWYTADELRNYVNVIIVEYVLAD